MKDADYIAHEQAEECYLCGKVFRCPPSCHGCEKCLGLGGKVRDHDHLLDERHLEEGKGNYRGASHYKCNLSYRQDRFIIPVLAHNAFRFAFQLIIKEMAKHAYPEDRNLMILSRDCSNS